MKYTTMKQACLHHRIPQTDKRFPHRRLRDVAQTRPPTPPPESRATEEVLMSRRNRKHRIFFPLKFKCTKAQSFPPVP